MIEPGGHLILRDIDLVMFTDENPPPLEGQEPDIVAYTQGKSTLATINRIFSGWALQQGFVVRCARTSLRSVQWLIRPQHFVSFPDDVPRCISSGLVIYPRPCPHGEYCASYKGLKGTSLSEFTASSSQSISQILNVMTSAMMKAGCLELGDGTRIVDEEERKALMKELRDFVEGGIFLPLSEWVVVRPLGS